MSDVSIKVGVVTDRTGPLSVMGIANANVASMVIQDINATGACWGGGSSCASRTVRRPTAWPRPGPPSS